ncbi:nitrite/sulfite reductase [Phycisphaera mikurensis]|uniref:Putative NADPH--sulfite reductase hemoprotein beta-component n=1 Tax=Phycisphaera mikurensis (strain NBRC 102666 / KCTC 22515 / FYK2301M01) TaxID=1142394 RepID=I0ICN3_PHYMF|nr:putative NADPH--sulfite reductase hemoprotein beta-component [Phycisphaera mikurensis]MBB6442104.1 sulfite reductase (NADPH) hemoprotein beta-component [Phycisphaera mikurensis]BAM03021.1 putative NADPH--sulfite reductase hemoprotein beta-component [Phycisphaera mikurensis NBRC 102666]
MARVKEPQPLIPTPQDQLSADEHFKIESAGMVGVLPERYRDHETMDLEKEAEFLSKSHGLYLEYNRAKTGVEKDWMYMVRVTVPGGGAFDARQWAILDSVADKYCDHNPYGGNSLRLTTRQNIQYHWLRKPQVMSLVQDIAKSGFYTLNGCGDNVRNVMGCPLSKFGTIPGANAFELSHRYGDYFRLPAASHIQVFAVDPNDIKDPEVQYDYGKQLLNRKFKIAFSTVHRDPRTGVVTADNCTEIRTNEVGVAPVVEGTGSDARVVGYQVYVGGGQGEKKGKPTFAAHGKALGVFTPDQLMPGLKAIVDVHKQWGDRKNRVWARLKYVVWKQGIAWYREQVKAEGVSFDPPDESLHPGERMLHHGWNEQESNGLWAYGAYVECGRLADGAYIDKAKLGDAREAAPHLAPSNSPDAEPTDAADGTLHAGSGSARLKSMVPAVLDAFPGTEVMVTPNQDLLFANIEEAAKEDFVAKLAEFGHGTRRGKAYSKLRVLSGACVGLPTCRLSYTDSEQFEPELMDQLEDMGYGDVAESIGITGCERQCFRPGTKSIGWVGSGGDNYGLKLGGSEDGSTQGHWLTDGEKQYLSMVPREEVANVCAVLFDWWKTQKQGNNGSSERLGPFVHRMGFEAVITRFRDDPRTSALMDLRNPKAGFDPYVPASLLRA